ncbi:hypothetical protein [Methylogaea oryzae]|nr:hypothetical protein [Methylogaea oryzae]
MQVLQNDPEAPLDLREKALRMAGRIIEFDPDVRGGQGYAIAREILESGRALAKMNRIIQAQGVQEQAMAPGQLTFEVNAERDGVVTGVDNYLLANTARLAGAPMAKGAGVDMFVKLGQPVKKGEPLYRVHAEFQSNFDFARDFTAAHSGYTIGEATEMPSNFTEFEP